MSKILGPDATLGVACFGITHPHTSGRVRAVQRLANARMMGAWDDSPLLQPFCDALGLEARSKQDILDDPNVHAVYIHSKSNKMADLSCEALEAGKAVLCEKPAGRNSADARQIVDAVKRTDGMLQVGLTLPLFCGVHNPRFTRPFCAVPRTSVFRTASG
jgi:predicted dehydrogenase